MLVKFSQLCVLGQGLHLVVTVIDIAQIRSVQHAFDTSEERMGIHILRHCQCRSFLNKQAVILVQVLRE